MNLQRLIELGFSPTVGQLDYQGKTYGTFNADGVYLTPEGEELVGKLGAAPVVSEEVAPVKRGPGRPRKVDVDSVGE